MDETALPVEPVEAPVKPPVKPPVKEPAVSADKLSLAEKLYEAATQLQRDADELLKSIREETPLEEEPAEKMTPEESEAANNAIIGL